MTRVAVVGNMTARNGRERVADVVRSVATRGHHPILVEAYSSQEAAAAIRDVVARGIDRLIAVGGDGVVHLAVNAVAGTTVPLGIVPHGTGNDFARALGLLDGSIDQHVDRALQVGVAVDAIRTTHGWVATVATLGFSGDVTARANALRWPKGQLRYSVATVLQLPRLRPRSLTLSIDGRRSDIETTLFAVGNTACFGGGMRICPGAAPDDGRLAVVSIGRVSRWRFLRVFPTVFSGGHVEHDDVTTESGSVIVVEDVGADGVDLWADGELLGPLPVTLEVVPGALRIAGARLDA